MPGGPQQQEAVPHTQLSSLQPGPSQGPAGYPSWLPQHPFPIAPPLRPARLMNGGDGPNMGMSP